MKRNNIYISVLGAIGILAYFVFYAVIVGGLIYVAIHFIDKFW